MREDRNKQYRMPWSIQVTSEQEWASIDICRTLIVVKTDENIDYLSFGENIDPAQHQSSLVWGPK
jgi:hypothetical protein